MKAPLAGIIIAVMSMAALAQSVPRFALRDTAGIVHHEEEWSKSRAVVIFFTTTDCPLSNNYVSEMNRIRADYARQNVAFYTVQTDTTISETEVRRHANEFGFTFPMLLDPDQFLVRLTSATATPEVAVLSKAGQVLYLGRIDNRVVDFDKRRPAATESDLRNALEAVVSGVPVAHPKTNVVGCAINLVKASGDRP